MGDIKKLKIGTGIPVKQKLRYLLSYQENIQKLKDKMKRLNEIKEQIYKAADKKDGGISKETSVVEWLKRLDETLEYANKLCDKHDKDEISRRCGTSSSWHVPDWKLMSRYQRGRDAKRLVAVLEGLESWVPSSKEVNYASQKLESRESMKEEILAALEQSSPNKTIAIYGSPGVGKGHLVTEIVKHVSDEGKMLVVRPSESQISNEVIQKEIKREMETRSKTNVSISKSKQSVLTILNFDKLDKIDDFKSLGIPLQDDDNYEGCKLLLVSRDRRVLQDKGVDTYFKLDSLNYEESYILFLIEASKGGLKDDVNLRIMAKHMASRCEGLPLGICKMAQQLCKTKEKEGNVNLNESYFEEMEKTILSSVEKSYNDLEDKAKQVFLLCVGTREAPISIDDLLKYVIGSGVFRYEYRSINDTREELKKMIDGLKASSLLVDDDNLREVKVNAIIYKATPLIASRNHPHHQVFRSNVFSPLKSWPENHGLQGCTHINLKRCHISELPTRLDCPNLNFLYLDVTNNSTLVIPESFFERTENLNVLDLIGMKMPSLPTSLVFLTKLKTLCLRQCNLENIAGIGALKNIEILSFCHSSIKEFLVEIVQLTHLRMLDLSYSNIEVIPSNIVSKLTKLEELYVGNLVISFKQSLKQILGALELLKSFTSLELQIHEDCISPSNKVLFEKLLRFNIVIGDGWEWSDSNGTSKILKLKLHNNIHLQALKILVKSAEDLYLDEINGNSNVICELNDGGFPGLRKLHIRNNTIIEHVVKSKKTNQTFITWFKELETLILVNLSKLEKVCEGPLALSSFGNLKVIKVKRCGRLEYLLPVSMIKQVPQLVEIDVYECISMKAIVCLDEGSSSSDPIVFSSLESLTLQHLTLNGGLGPIREGIPTNNPPLFSNPNQNPDPLPGVKHLKLTNVTSINHLASLTTNDANSGVPLQSLESLEIDGCCDISYLFNSNGFEMHATFKGLLPKMRQLFLLNLGSFESIVSPKHPEEILNFHWLNHLKLFNCKRLKYVLPLYILKNLKQLKTIDVRDCDNLERLFGDEKDKEARHANETLLPSLHSLRLTNLPMLISICSGGHHIISNSLTQMIAQNCPNFAFTFSNSKVTSFQETDIFAVQNSKETIYPCFLENLDLGGLNKLEMITKYLLVSFMHLTSLKVYECDNLKNLLHFRVAQRLSSLQELMIISCKNVEQILWSGTTEGKPSEKDIVIEFPKVKSLVLDNLPELIGVFHEYTIMWPALERVRIVRCPKIERSWLGTVNELLLGTLEVIQCEPWETVDPEKNIYYLFHLTDETSQLTELEIDNSDKLERYLHMKFGVFSFWELKILKVAQCGVKISKLVSILLPRADQLKEMVVEKCESLEQVFDLREFHGQNQTYPGFPNLKTIRLFDLPKLKCIWNNDPIRIVTLRNLIKLEIIKCGLIKSLISLVVLEELAQLKELKIESCQMIEHVVDENEEMENKEFPNLSDLQLLNLPNLMKFNSGHCIFIFPKLLTLRIEKCPKMNSFTAGLLNSQEIAIEVISDHVELNEMMHACPELQTLKLEGLQALKVDSLIRLENLKTLIIRNCSSLEHLVLPSNYSSMREIEISGCNYLEGICTDLEQEKTENTTPFYLRSIVLENLPVLSRFSLESCEKLALQKLRIANCPMLVTLPWNISTKDDNQLNKISTSLVLFDSKKEDPEFKPNEGQKALRWLKTLELSDINLWKMEPKFPVFQSLSILRIMHCKPIPIAKLFSISVAQHLSDLKSLTLYGCENMVQVLEGGGEKSKQVVFQNLETLVLRNLPKLTSFCEDANVDIDEFPELKKVRVENVGNMSTFVKKSLRTPKLKQVHVTNITKCWQGDINKTITYLHQNPRVMDRLEEHTRARFGKTETNITTSSSGNSLKH